MNKSKNVLDELIEILHKKAKGFYYHEIQYEYQKTQISDNFNANHTDIYKNMDFFEIIDRGSTTSNNKHDIIKSIDNNQEIESDANLNLTKKKITTHFVPPDLQAIKMLSEIYINKNKDNSVENLSDEELILLKNKLLKEITNDDYKANKTN